MIVFSGEIVKYFPSKQAAPRRALIRLEQIILKRAFSFPFIPQSLLIGEARA
jgi:hypothetical protein